MLYLTRQLAARVNDFFNNLNIETLVIDLSTHQELEVFWHLMKELKNTSKEEYVDYEFIFNQYNLLCGINDAYGSKVYFTKKDSAFKGNHVSISSSVFFSTLAPNALDEFNKISKEVN